MITYNIHVRRKALKDLDQIRDYLNNILRNHKAAVDFVNAVNTKLEQIAKEPHLYPYDKIGEIVYRKAMVKQYIIAFCIDETSKTVHIIAVGHSRQRRSKLIKR